MAKFDKTYCSQCGAEFGPNDSGFSHCDQHALLDRDAVRLSDEYSPMVKRAMEKFWNLLDRRRAAERAQPATDTGGE